MESDGFCPNEVHTHIHIHTHTHTHHLTPPPYTPPPGAHSAGGAQGRPPLRRQGRCHMPIKPSSNTVFLTYLHTTYVSFIHIIPYIPSTLQKCTFYRRDLAIPSRRIRVCVSDNENTKLLLSMLRVVGLCVICIMYHMYRRRMQLCVVMCSYSV
jgi:hypothetical protein